MKCIKTLILLLFSTLLLSGCVARENDNNFSFAYKVDIFNGTPAEALAKAVNTQNIEKIRKITKNYPMLLDYKEPKFDETVLFWAVKNRKYNAIKELLICGANPNVICERMGGTALVAAIDFPYNDFTVEGCKSSYALELLLKYGASPNIPMTSSIYNNKIEGEDMLTYSLENGFEKTKLLIDYGADINYCSSVYYEDVDGRYVRNSNAVEMILCYGMKKQAEYLIIEKHANCLHPFKYMDNKDCKTFSKVSYPVDDFLYWWYNWGKDSNFNREDDYRYAIKIAKEMISQCRKSDDRDAVDYTLKKLKEEFPELF